MLFISDGAAEARNKTGEMYGFERTSIISILAVNQIAEKANKFGQEDDITLLGVARRWTAPYAFLLPGIVIWRYWRGRKEVGLLILPVLLMTFNSIFNEIGEPLFQVRPISILAVKNRLLKLRNGLGRRTTLQY
jgi:hypothetical protein